MKIINEKGKLFGIINVVDLICILIVLLLVIGVGWKLLGDKVQETVSPTTTMTTTLRIRGAQSYLIDELEKHDITGDQLVAGNDYVPGAYVKSVEFIPYVTQATTDEGVIVDAEDPTKMDVIVIVESEISSTTPILKIGTQEVRAGRTFTIKTRYFETAASIESVELASDK